MTDAPPCKSPALLAFEAETARLKALTEFLGAFVPSLCERAEPGTEDVGDDVAKEIEDARTEAIVEAFRAVALIAQSWPPIEYELDPEPDPTAADPRPVRPAEAAA